MDKQPQQRNDPLADELNEYRGSAESHFSSQADAAGYWFATAVVLTFIAAGIIVYRTGNDEIRTAVNDIPSAAAQADPLQPPPILQTR